MTDRARKFLYWGTCGLAALWLALGGLDIALDLHRGRDIAVIEVVVVLAIGLMIWLMGYLARSIK